jgi:hypothetical protein
VNCPHGVGDEENCHERACVQNVFDHVRRGGAFGVMRLVCDTCGHGVGCRRLKRDGGGLSARTIREFNARHRGHETHWKMIDVDSKLELLGGGPPPVLVDSDEEIDALVKSDS